MTAKLKRAYLDSVLNLNYKEGIDIYESYAIENKLNSIQKCELALLYDHLAICSDNIDLKEKYEERALGLCHSALNDDPNCYQALEGIGRIYWHRRDPLSIDYYTQALDFYSKSKRWMGFENLGNAFMSFGDYKKSEKNYSLALKYGGDHHYSVFYNLSQLYRKMGLIAEAKIAAENALNHLENHNIDKMSETYIALKKNLRETLDEFDS